MAKFFRRVLTRGAKLIKDIIYLPLEAYQFDLTTAGSRAIEVEQVKAKYAPFRLNLSIPHMGLASNSMRAPNTEGGSSTAIPFMLPPLQDELDFVENVDTGNAPKAGEEAPIVLLDEFSLSFDTRGEPAGIVSNWSGTKPEGSSADQGKLCYELISKYNLTITILEKKPIWGQAYPTNFEPTSIIWTGEVVADIELSSGYIRTGNPFVITDIRKAIDPYKSYLLVITAPNMATGLGGADGPLFELVSLEVSMRFLSPLRERDSGVNIQNIPTRHLGERNKLNTWSSTGAGQHSSTARPLITATPAAGDDIEANTATGVQTSMAVVDEIFRSKIQGGYDFDSEVPNLESLKDSAAYSVIAVPLFNCTQYGGIALENAAGAPVGYPYVTSTAGKFIDRRYVPIAAPMTIHHVLFTYSWNPFMTPAGLGWAHTIREMPAGALAGEELFLDIGVGMGTGARADAYSYEQIARQRLQILTMDRQTTGGVVENWFGAAIDGIRYGTGSLFPTIGGAGDKWLWNHEIHAMDVAPAGGGRPGLNGMTRQGYPVFVGRSLAGVGGPAGGSPLLANQRTNMDDGAPSAAIGAEQFLEVRAQLSDDNGDWGTNWKANQMLLGAGGIWVYIIGKTSLV